MNKEEMSPSKAICIGKLTGLALATIFILIEKNPDKVDLILDKCEDICETVYESVTDIKENLIGEAEPIIYEDNNMVAKLPKGMI